MWNRVELSTRESTEGKLHEKETSEHDITSVALTQHVCAKSLPGNFAKTQLTLPLSTTVIDTRFSLSIQPTWLSARLTPSPHHLLTRTMKSYLTINRASRQLMPTAKGWKNAGRRSERRPSNATPMQLLQQPPPPAKKIKPLPTPLPTEPAHLLPTNAVRIPHAP